jgi:hypothetical protein
MFPWRGNIPGWEGRTRIPFGATFYPQKTSADGRELLTRFKQHSLAASDALILQDPDNDSAVFSLPLCS